MHEMKVYVLTHGEYGDNRVVGVYSTKEKARAAYNIIKYLGTRYDKPRIKEYIIDDFIPENNALYF